MWVAVACESGLVMEANGMQRDSFLVRIWRESGRTAWRGWVQHTGSGESRQVRNWGELLAFIELYAGELADPPRKGLR